ncbi:MAG: glycoside hydrolase family 88 protein [Spirochaetales bacterium]|nr:glycoside hydrolase family 88 protein [Spirochaetales bacterium]
MNEDKSIKENTLRLIADAVLKSATFRFIDRESGEPFLSPAKAPGNTQLIPESPYTDWRYWNGVLNIAMMKLGELLKEPRYTAFPEKNIAFVFDNYHYFEKQYKNERKWYYPFGQFFLMEELDDCGAMGASVIEVYKQDNQDRYRQYIEKTAEHILKKQDRMNDGTLVRTFPQKWTIWADDLYMSISFLSRMGEFTGESRYIDEAVCQVINFHNYLFNHEKGLMSHSWYSDSKQPGVAFWGRANGWTLLAQIELLDRLPESHRDRKVLLTLLKQHILGIARYQNSEGLWRQLLDKTDSYPETSCSAMFTYAITRAINRGFIEPRYISIAYEGWEGICSRIRPDGKIEGICTGTSVGNDLVYYYRRPAPLNDIHGIGPILLAGTEIF